MKKIILTINLCMLIFSGISQTKNVYSASFFEPGFPSKPKSISEVIIKLMRGKSFTIETARLETGIDTLVGYFGIIKRDDAPEKPIYTAFITKPDSLLSGQLGFIILKDTLNYLKADLDLSLSMYSKDKIHLTLRYNPDNKTVLYKWGNGIGNIIGKPEIVIDNVFKVGNEFPPLKIKVLGGTEIGVKDIKDKIVVINWWHTRCGPCLAEMPSLNELVDIYGKRVDVLFLSIADNTEKELTDFLKIREFKYKQGLKTEAAKQILGTGYPQHIIMDKNGKIAFFASGGGDQAAKVIKNEIDKLLK